VGDFWRGGGLNVACDDTCRTTDNTVLSGNSHITEESLDDFVLLSLSTDRQTDRQSDTQSYKDNCPGLRVNSINMTSQ